VSAVNNTGPFDILPGHKNFLTLLKPSEIIVRTDTGEERFRIDRGVMHVKSGSVTVFLDV
jgi:F0F1-type ATP synthase epsilon subunit